MAENNEIQAQIESKREEIQKKEDMLTKLKDDLAYSLQMCDQLTYDNVFVYFQPGSGKINIKEPVEFAEKAARQIATAIDESK